MSKKIFKLQVPLFGDPQAMVYDESRREQYFFPVTNDLLEFTEGEPKCFVFGKFNKVTDLFEIEGKAPWQEW